jgi:hypothetical protein
MTADSGPRVGFATAIFTVESVYDLTPYMEGEEDYGPCPCFTIRQPGFVAEGRCWRAAHDTHSYGSRRSDGRCCVHVWHPRDLTGERRRQFRQMARRLRDLLDAADWYGGWALVIEPSLAADAPLAAREVGG